MSKGFKGMMAAIISLTGALAFFVGFVINGAFTNTAVAMEGFKQNTTADVITGNETEINEREEVTDSAGNKFMAPLDADNIITLNTNAYDMLTALGKSEAIKGTSSDTKYPESKDSLTKYGTEKSPDISKIKTDAPDAVVASADFKGSEGYSELTKAGIDVVCVNLNNSEEMSKEISVLGKLFSANETAESFNADTDNIKNLISSNLNNVNEVSAYWEKNDNYTSINKKENENILLSAARVKSVTSDKKENDVKVDGNFVKEANPGIIVKVSDYDKKVLNLYESNLGEAQTQVDEILKRNEISDITAVKDKKVLILSERIVNTPLGNALAPLYIAKMAYPDNFKDVNPGDYLNDFLSKYWGDNLTGALAYAGDVSLEENQSSNVVATSTSTGSLLSSLASSSPAATVRSGSPANTNTKIASANTNKNKNTSSGNNNSGKKQNDVSTSKNTEVVQDSAGQKIKVDKDDGNTGIKSCIVYNSSVYEMIKIFGGQDTVIGVAESLAKSSDFPELANKKTYGKWNAPNAEAIIEDHPDVVFAYANYGQEALQKVRDAGITVVSLNLYIPSEIDDEIITLGKIFGNEALATEWNKDIDEIQNLVASRTKYVSKATCYWETYSDYSSVADGSGGAELLSLAGVYNIYDKSSAASYPKVSDEWVIQKNPDVVVKVCSSTTTSPTYCMGTTVNDYSLAKAVYNNIASRTGWSEINAVKNEKVLLLHSKVGTTAFGCAVAPLYIAKVAYPDKFADVDADSYARAFYKKYWKNDLTGTWRFSYQKLN